MTITEQIQTAIDAMEILQSGICGRVTLIDKLTFVHTSLVAAQFALDRLEKDLKYEQKWVEPKLGGWAFDSINGIVKIIRAVDIPEDDYLCSITLDGKTHILNDLRPLKRSDLEKEIKGVKVRAKELGDGHLIMWFGTVYVHFRGDRAKVMRALLAGKVPIMPSDFRFGERTGIRHPTSQGKGKLS